MRFRWIAMSLFVAWLAIPSLSHGQQTTIYRKLSMERLERLLSELGVKHTKQESTRKNGTWFYYFQAQGHTVVLHYYSGDDLMLACDEFTRTTVERANAWNVRAKFSRSYLENRNNRQATVLEWNLDCGGGITDAQVRLFFQRFYAEMTDFERFLSQ